MYIGTFPFGFEGRISDLIILVLDYYLSFYFAQLTIPSYSDSNINLVTDSFLE